MKTDVESVASLIESVAPDSVDSTQKQIAFGELVRRFQDMAYACAFAVLGDSHLAEDAAQEAFITAYQNLSSLRDAKAFSGWLRRIVLTQCNRITRKRRLTVEPISAAMDIPTVEADAAQIAERNEEREMVWRAIAQLPKNQRVVVTLFYINEFAQNEIADFLEIPTKTVKSRLQFARKRLKMFLSPDLVGERMNTMVKDALSEERPSQDDAFVKQVLFKAIEQADVKKVEELLNADSVLAYAKDEKGRTPIEVLIGGHIGDWQFRNLQRRQPIYEMLTEKGAMPEFAQSIIANDLPRVKMFLDKRPQFISERFAVPPPGRGLTLLPLALAAIYERIETMELLVQTGADVNADNDRALAYTMLSFK